MYIKLPDLVMLYAFDYIIYGAQLLTKIFADIRDSKIPQGIMVCNFICNL